MQQRETELRAKQQQLKQEITAFTQKVLYNRINQINIYLSSGRVKKPDEMNLERRE